MIKPKTANYLKERFKTLSAKAVAYHEKINTAKTDLKKQYYRKKLQKVSTEAADIAVFLDAALKAEENKKNEPEV